MLESETPKFIFLGYLFKLEFLLFYFSVLILNLRLVEHKFSSGFVVRILAKFLGGFRL